MAELNPKQEKFAQLYVQLGNASEAYRQAYNSTAKPESVNVNASKMLSDTKVSLRVEEIREALRANHGITLQDLLKELEEARKAALSAETVQSSAAVNATMSKAKLLGFDKPQPPPEVTPEITIKVIRATRPVKDAD